MAICKFCGKEKSGAASCLESRIVINDTNYSPVPYEKRLGSGFRKASTVSRCSECHVANGGFHHVGCTLEVCPKCGDRWVYCRCNGTKIRMHEVSSDSAGKLIPFPGSTKQRV